ncbi:MAG: SpoIIE family protein phosphatase [Candidatus Competibacteraceae bacterium]|nr:SpoIIE family protein phosphatase [Candidatus Competibacteraceae bacterium]
MDLAIADDKEPQVLILNSYHKGYEWTDRQVEGIEEVFSAASDVRLRVEYMDTGLVDKTHYENVLKTIYQHKYDSANIEVIIAIDNAALDFLSTSRKTLFSDVPVVFSGVSNVNEETLKALGNLTGIKGKTDFARNIELVLELYPVAQRIYVIADSTPDGELLVEEFIQAAAPFRDNITFEYLIGLGMDELTALLGQLPVDSAVLYLGFFRDNTGQEFSPEEVIPQISEASSVPVFGTTDYMIGYGIVGGHLKSAYSIGQTAGRLAQQILAGTAIGQFPIVIDATHEYMFDFRQLARFNLPYHRLPDDSLVIEEPDTFYYRYRKLLWPVLGVFSLMLIYIVTLLINIRKRKKAQRGLQNILDQTNQLFQLDSLEKFGRDIQTRLAAVLPLKCPPLLFKYAGQTGQGQFNSGQLYPVLPLPAHSEAGRLPNQVQLQQAVEHAHSSYAEYSAAIFFNNPDMPANLALVNTQTRLDDIDRRLLDIFASNVAVSIDNIEKYKLVEALETARKIQESMLPRGFQEIAEPYGVDLYAYLLPAKDVSGDLYDFFAIDEDRLCVLVGDVSDKGMPAALFMAASKTLIRAVAETHTDPAALLEKVNKGLCRDNELSMFVTLFLAIFDRRSGELVCVNGGHNPPYLLHQGTVEMVAAEQGIALGIMDDISFVSWTIQLQPGAALFIYTDGISEAMDTAHEQFGDARLQQALAESAEQSSDAIIRHVLNCTESFVQGAPQSDDITLLCLRRAN